MRVLRPHWTMLGVRVLVTCAQLRQCDLRAISAAAQQSASLRRSHAEFASGKPVAGHFDYDFEDLIQAANTQIESVVSRVHICEQDNGNKRQPEASPGANHSPVSAAVSELAEELLMALRDCAQLRRCVCCLRHSFDWQLVWHIKVANLGTVYRSHRHYDVFE